MPSAGTFDISGIKETLVALQDFKKSTARNVMERALKRAATPIVAAAIQNAPVKTGKLRASIRSSVLRGSAGKSAYAASKAAGGSDSDAAAAAHAANKSAAGTGLTATVRVAAHAFYGAMVELGTTHAAAHPFLGPAFRANRSAAANSIAADLKIEIDASARRIAARKTRKPTT